MRAAWALLSLIVAAPSFGTQPRSPLPHGARNNPPVYLSLMGEPFRGEPGEAPPLAAWVALADRDGNGSISLTELVKDAERFFEVLDLNKNGRLDRDEMDRYEKEIAPPSIRLAGGMTPAGMEGGRRPSRSGGPPGGMPGGTPSRGLAGGARDRGMAMPGVPQPVAMADLDLNFLVTAEEFSKTAVRRFAASDRDKDGALAGDELLRRPPRRP